jgi:SpoVK/Ycf46/Vps4 family AAA+-type ATPase
MEEFDGVREALIGFKEGEIEAEVVCDLYADMDGIDRSIAVARAKREQTMSDEDLDEMVCVDA